MNPVAEDEPTKKPKAKSKRRTRDRGDDPGHRDRATAERPRDDAEDSAERSAPEAQQKDVPAPTEAVEPSRFTRAFPKDDVLDRLVAAFERGDYALVRAEAPALARRTNDPEIRRAALELRRRIDPDRLSLALIGFAFALLVVLSVYYWTHKHP